MKMGHQILVLSTEGFQLVEYFLQTLFGIENSRFVHIIPESVNSLIQQEFIFQAEPAAGLGIQHIRKVDPPRPHGCHKVISFLVFTEISFFHPFFVDRITFLNFYACVNNRYQVDMLFLHFFDKSWEIRKGFLIQSKVFKTFHIVDIQINAVQRDVQFPVSLFNFPDVLFRLITPAALAESKSPFGRNIAAADHLAELTDDVFQIFSINIIQVHIPAVHGDHGRILLGIADVKSDFSRIVQEKTERFCLGEDQEIVGAIKRVGIFPVVGIIGTVAGIDPAPFVNAPDLFPKAVDRCALGHEKGDFFPFFNFYTGDFSFFYRVFFYHCFCIQRFPKMVFTNHIYLLSSV